MIELAWGAWDAAFGRYGANSWHARARRAAKASAEARYIAEVAQRAEGAVSRAGDVGAVAKSSCRARVWAAHEVTIKIAGHVAPVSQRASPYDGGTKVSDGRIRMVAKG